jgi:hypothetical protein
MSSQIVRYAPTVRTRVNLVRQIRKIFKIQVLLIGFVYLNAGELARNRFAFGRFNDGPTQSKFPVVSLDPRTNDGLVPKFSIALYAS